MTREDAIARIVGGAALAGLAALGMWARLVPVGDIRVSLAQAHTLCSAVGDLPSRCGGIEGGWWACIAVGVIGLAAAAAAVLRWPASSSGPME